MILAGRSIHNSVINVFKKIEYLANIPLTLSLSPKACLREAASAKAGERGG